MNKELRYRIMLKLEHYMHTLDHSSKEFEEVYDLYLDVKWAGTDLDCVNPNHY